MAAELDLNQHLIKHPAATFLVRAAGDSMIGAGIHPNDILIVDRGIEAENGRIVIAAIDGSLTVKRLSKSAKGTLLVPENENYEPMRIGEGSDVVIWGVVTFVIHSV